MAKGLKSLKEKVINFMSSKKDKTSEEQMNDNIQDTENKTDATIETEVVEKSEIEMLQEANEKLKQEVAEKNDKFLRLFAEFDNYKKRTAKERLEIMKTAGKDVIVDLLPILDDFERAIVNENASEGFELIFKKLFQNLEAKGLKKMDCKETPFDAEIHEAITEIPAPTEDLKGKVVDVVENGYTLNDKIIRYAKVVVGK